MHSEDNYFAIEAKKSYCSRHDKSKLVGLVNSHMGYTCGIAISVSYTHLRAHETVLDLVCRLLLEKKKQTILTLPIHVTTQ